MDEYVNAAGSPAVVYHTSSYFLLVSMHVLLA